MTRSGRVLVTLATLFAILATFAVWADRQLFDDDDWSDTSSALIEDTAIRGEIAAFLVDELFAGGDVERQLESLLPPRAAGLAGPMATGLREVAERGAARLLARPRSQHLWEQASKRAQAALVELVEGSGPAGGDVELDLHELLVAIQQQTGAGGQLARALPADAGRTTILRADELNAARDVVDLFQKLVVVLAALAFALCAAALGLARGRRREALRSCGLGLVAAGSVVLLGRALAGDALVDALADSAAVQPAVDAAWRIGTSLLAEMATAVIGYGIVIVVAAWLAGPTRRARGVRGVLAPHLREAHVAYGAVAILVLLLLAWDPAPATHRVVPMLVFTALLAVGVEVLRRQVAGEAR